MTVEELIQRLSKYDKSLEVTIGVTVAWGEHSIPSDEEDWSVQKSQYEHKNAKVLIIDID